jgi:hypothetical protein
LGEKLKESWFPVWFEELETQLRGSRRESGEPINPDRPDDQPALYRVQEWPTVPDDDGESEPLDMPGAPDIEHEQGSQAYVQQQFDTAWDFYDQCVTAGVINLKQKAALICAEVDALAEMAVDQLPDWTKLTDRKTRQLRYYAFRRALKDQGIPRGEVKNLAAFERYVERAIQKVRTYAKPPKH